MMTASRIPDFAIGTYGKISRKFRGRNLLTFTQAALFIRQLPYGRNPDKSDPVAVFSDQCGTCSTKHALLKRLADENGFECLRLMIGLFRMNGINTPSIASTLRQHNLEYIPEAHCYLKYGNSILDYTRKNSKSSDFTDDLIEELEISPDQIGDYKINYHKSYLRVWFENIKRQPLSDDIWAIREQCIKTLTDNL